LDRRGVYRAIEEAAETGRFEDGQYPHSALSRRLRYKYRENRDLRGILIGHIVSISAIASHPRVNVNSGISARKELIREVFRTIPYMSDDEEAGSERERAVELFNEVAGEMERLVGRLDGTAGKVDIESE
jgi:hypothetical protein